MKIFTIGPVEMYPSTKKVRMNDIVYFRTEKYSNIVQNSLKELSDLLGNNEENSLIYLAGSGTAAMEATVENCLNQNDKALVINGGVFGHRFCELLEYHHIMFDSINLKWNEKLTNEHLLPYENKDYTALLVNIHETHTGQLYDIQILSNFCKRNNLYFIVDAISSFLADEYDMDRYSVDTTIISSQKGLCLSPGMSFVSMSKRMIDKVNENQNISSKYFDFKDYLLNIKRGQTPYTPPVCVMYELEDMLHLIRTEGGKTARLKAVKEKCDYFRKRIREIGLKIPDYPLSNMLTPIEFNDIDAYSVMQTLKNKYDIYVNPCSGDMAHKLLRISHIGNTTLQDFEMLIQMMKKSIVDVKNNGESAC